jgi:L-rhamnonate dehydratase
MRITRVTALHPHTKAGPPDWRTSLGQFVAGVETDSGVRGIGVGGGGPVGVAVIEAVLGPLLVGQSLESVADVEQLWERMYQATLAFCRKGLAIMAISAVDLALWDALARSQGISVAQLLSRSDRNTSGPRAEVPCYATSREPEAETAKGFRAVKLALSGTPFAEAIDRVTRVRRAIGPDVQLMTDAWGQWSLEQSLRAVEAFKELNVGWLEEPLPADLMEEYAELCRRSPVPIAGGEHEYTVHGFRELADHGAHAVWQPDVCWTGGLTQLRAIYALAAKTSARGPQGEQPVRVVPHRGAEVWSLHAIASLDPDPLAESGRPWLRWIENQPEIVGGRVRIPDEPGFGVNFASEVEAELWA